MIRNGQRNSFHGPMKVTSTTVTSAGRTSGRAIFVSSWISLAPSMRAASKIACGSCRKYCRKMITAVELIAKGRIIPR